MLCDKQLILKRNTMKLGLPCLTIDNSKWYCQSLLEKVSKQPGSWSLNRDYNRSHSQLCILALHRPVRKWHHYNRQLKIHLFRVAYESALYCFYSLNYYAPTPQGGGGIKRSSASVVCPSVCLMSRTSALTRKPKGLGRRNFAQGYPRSHATPTPTSRSKGQKSRSAGAGAYCGGHLATQLVLCTLNL